MTVRVYTNQNIIGYIDYADGDDWTVTHLEGLEVVDEDGIAVAEFPHGSWRRVEDLRG